MQISNSAPARHSTSLSDSTRLRQIVGVSILIAASLISSFAFTCAIPLAALAAFAALKLKPREAVLSIGAVWLINQLVGLRLLELPAHSGMLRLGYRHGHCGLCSPHHRHADREEV